MPHSLDVTHARAIPKSQRFMLCCYAVMLFDAATIYDQPLTNSPTLDALRVAVNARLSDDHTHDLAVLLVNHMNAHPDDDRTFLVDSYAFDLIDYSALYFLTRKIER